MTPAFSKRPSRRRTTRQNLGDRAEKRALKFLQNNGLTVVERNFRCRFGEIDLIMQEPGCLVFVEVRCRRSTSFLSPALSVDAAKQAKIQRAASSWLAGRSSLADESVRFDVIAVENTARGPVRIQWVRDAFRC